MSNSSNIKGLSAGAVSAALTVVLLLINIHVPIIGGAALFFIGTPVAYVAVKHKFAFSCISYAAAVLIMLIITGDVFGGFIISAVKILPGIAIGYCIKNKYSFGASAAASIVTVLFGFLLQILILNATTSSGNILLDVINQSADAMKEIAAAAAANLGETNAAVTAAVSQFNTAIDAAKNSLAFYMPAMIMIVALVIGYAVYMCAVFVLSRAGIENIDYTKFSMIKLPKPLAYISAILFIVASMSFDTTVYTQGLKNTVTVLVFIMAVCGLSFIDYKLSAMVKSGYARFGIYAAVALFGYMFIYLIFIALTIAGMVDAVYDFRKIKEAGDSGEDK